MLFSIALIFLLGLFLGKMFQILKLPSLLGMLISGIILGPFCLNLIDSSVLSISDYLKEISLIIILTRAGLSLDIKDLKKAGLPAILLCFVPATFEIVGMLIFAPVFLGISLLDSLIMGTVIAAVSPAVIVPKMLKLQDEKYGIDKKIPQMILAGASIDDIYVIVLFSISVSMAMGNKVNIFSLMNIPLSVFLGITFGIIMGFIYFLLFSKFHIRDTTKVILMISISFLIIYFTDYIKNIISISGLLTVMTSGMILLIKKRAVASRLATKYSKLWVGAEVLLFVLIGTNLNLEYLFISGFNVLVLIICVLIIRMIGVFISLLGTALSIKEKLFCMISYMPKATVQAAIGSLPLSMGLSCGNIVLTVAVVSILITAPLGSLLIDISYKKMLLKSST